jgi:hypothetical protein
MDAIWTTETTLAGLDERIVKRCRKKTPDAKKKGPDEAPGAGALVGTLAWS